VGLTRAVAAILCAEEYAGPVLMRSMDSRLTMDDMPLRNTSALLRRLWEIWLMGTHDMGRTDLCLRVSSASMTRSKPISLQITRSGSMCGRQIISCTSRPDRFVHRLHLFTQASADSPQLEYRVSLVRGPGGRVAAMGAGMIVERYGAQLAVTAGTVEVVTPVFSTVGWRPREEASIES
jgi:hypothetical protein